jgi:hypothetical protein
MLVPHKRFIVLSPTGTGQERLLMLLVPVHTVRERKEAYSTVSAKIGRHHQKYVVFLSPALRTTDRSVSAALLDQKYSKTMTAHPAR